jgi:toxin YoeB
MKSVTLSVSALKQLDEWKRKNPGILKKIIELITDISTNPFTGIGKPEPLKHELKGKWSRRITGEHRLVYEIKDETIVIVSCMYHY